MGQVGSKSLKVYFECIKPPKPFIQKIRLQNNIISVIIKKHTKLGINNWTENVSGQPNQNYKKTSKILLLRLVFHVVVVTSGLELFT